MQIRILDCLIGWAGSADVAALALAKIGIGAATSKADTDVRWLIAAGWLKVLPKKDKKRWRPTRYQLTLPTEGPWTSAPYPAAPPPPVTLAPTWLLERNWRLWVGERNWRRCIGGHDAFRRAKGTLNAAYPVLTLLSDAPTTAVVLASWLRMPERRVKDHADELVRAGVAHVRPDGYARVQGPLTALLDTVAIEADRLGDHRPERPTIAGTRARAIEDLKERFADWVQQQETWLEEFDVPGSDTWLQIQTKQLMKTMNGPSGEAFLKACAETGRRPEELAAEVAEGYFHQIERNREEMGAWLDLNIPDPAEARHRPNDRVDGLSDAFRGPF